MAPKGGIHESNAMKEARRRLQALDLQTAYRDAYPPSRSPSPARATEPYPPSRSPSPASQPEEDVVAMTSAHRLASKTSLVTIKRELTPRGGRSARWCTLKKDSEKKESEKKESEKKESEKPKPKTKPKPKRPPSKKEKDLKEEPKTKPKPKGQPSQQERDREAENQRRQDMNEEELRQEEEKRLGRCDEEVPNDDFWEDLAAPADVEKKKKKDKKKRHVTFDEDVEHIDVISDRPAPSPKKKKDLKDVGGRNFRCRALMRFRRAKAAIKSGKGKTFEEGGKHAIPFVLHDAVISNPDGVFEKYMHANCDWNVVVAEEIDSSEKMNSDIGKRAWVFDDELLKTVCKGNVPRYTNMKKQLINQGFIRTHPDMQEDDQHAVQYHALTLDENTKGKTDKHMKRVTKRTEDPKSPKRLLRATKADGSPSPAKKARVEKESPKTTETAEKHKTVDKPRKDKEKEQETGTQKDDAAAAAKEAKAKAAQDQKDKVQKQQEAEAKKKKKDEDPVERSKVFMQSCGGAIRDLQVSSSEMKTKKVKQHIPSRFLKEYQATVDGHLAVLVSARSDMEAAVCKDPKKYVAKIGGTERIVKAEAELATTKKTLKAWRNSMHVYLNGVQKEKS